MSFLSRLTTLARADAHGVVDALEDKSLLLRQHLREAGSELARKRSRLEALASEERSLEERGERLQKRIDSLEADVTLALDSDQEDLARFALRQLLPLRRAAEQTVERRQHLERERRDVNERLEVQDQEYARLETEVHAALARCEQEGQPLDVARRVSDEEVELELLRRSRTRGEGGG